jgi:putative aldouronate transport system substrate-binding protein
VDDATNTDLAKNVPGASFIPVDLNLNNKSMMDKTGLYMFVPGFSKNQKEALQYLNWLARFENYNYLQVGEAGRNHNLVNGVPSVIASTDPKWIQNSSLNIDYTMPVNGTDLGSQDMNMKALALSYPGYNADIIGNAYSISIKDARAPIVHPGTITKTQNSQTLSDKADALLSQAITASPANFDSVWDTGLRDWLASGAQEMIDERTGLWPN